MSWIDFSTSPTAGADSISVLQDSIVVLYVGDGEISRDTVRFPSSIDAQTLNVSGDTLSISNGNSVILPVPTPPDLSPYATIVSVQDTAAAIRGDFHIDTDAQNLSLSNDTLSIERGNSLFLPYAAALVDTAAAIRGDFPVNTDAQTLSITNDTLSISGGNSVPLPYEPVFKHCVLTASGGTVTFDAANCNTAYVLLAGDYALTITNATIGFYTLRVDQDATGGRTLTYTNNPMTQESAAIEIGTAANSKSILIFYYDGTNFLLQTGINYGN